MGSRYTTTTASEELAHYRLVLSHSKNEGCTNSGCLGCLGGAGKARVGMGQGQQRRVQRQSYGKIVQHVRRALEPSTKAQKREVIVGVIDEDHGNESGGELVVTLVDLSRDSLVVDDCMLPVDHSECLTLDLWSLVSP